MLRILYAQSPRSFNISMHAKPASLNKRNMTASKCSEPPPSTRGYHPSQTMPGHTHTLKRRPSSRGCRRRGSQWGCGKAGRCSGCCSGTTCKGRYGGIGCGRCRSAYPACACRYPRYCSRWRTPSAPSLPQTRYAGTSSDRR